MKEGRNSLKHRVEGIRKSLNVKHGEQHLHKKFYQTHRTLKNQHRTAEEHLRTRFERSTDKHEDNWMIGDS